MNKTGLSGVVLLIPVLLSGCASPGGWYDDWGKCAVAASVVGAGMGAIEASEAAAAGAVGGALIGGVLCAIMDTNEAPVDPDSDGDGVLDSMDQCPATAPGLAVDTMGCPVPEVVEEVPEIIVLEGVNFHTNSSLLTEDSGLILDKVVETLRMHPNLTIEVAGYTDSDGEAEYNQWLSLRRANAVMSFLVDHGVDASNLSANGYGEDQPIADNETPEGKARNRRVELHIK